MPSPFPVCSEWFCSPSRNFRAHPTQERWPLLPTPMLDVVYQTESPPSSSPAPSPQTLFANLSKRIRALTGAGQTLFVPRLSFSSLSLGRNCQTESRQTLPGVNKLLRIHSRRWWHLCLSNFHPVNLLLFLLPS